MATLTRYHFWGRSVDTFGNIKPATEVSVFETGTTTAASLYIAGIGGTALTTAPQLTTDNHGRFNFWIDIADYEYSQLFDIQVVGGVIYEQVDIYRAGTFNLELNDIRHRLRTWSDAVSGKAILDGLQGQINSLSLSANVEDDDLYSKINFDTAEVSGAVDDLRSFVILNDLALSGAIEFERRYTRTEFASAAGNIHSNHLYPRTLGASAAIRFDDLKNYVDVSVANVSAGSDDLKNYVDLRTQQVSSGVDDLRSFTLDRLAVVSGGIDDLRSFTILNDLALSGAIEFERRYTRTEFASAAENIHDLHSDIRTLGASAGSRFDSIHNRVTDQHLVVSAGVDDLRSFTLDRLAVVSGATDDLRSFTILNDLALSGAIEFERQYTRTEFASAAGNIHDLHSDIRTLGTSATLRFDSIHNRVTDQQSIVSAGLDDLHLYTVTQLTSAGIEFDDLRNRLFTHEVSAKGELDDIVDELRTLGASANQEIYDIRREHEIDTVYVSGAFRDLHSATSEPTGFPNTTDSTITFDDGNAEMNISGNFDIWISGKRYYSTGLKTASVAGSGMNYFYMNSDANMGVTQVFTPSILLRDNALVSAVYWDPEYEKRHLYKGDERHGITWDWNHHGYVHATEGTKYESGLALTDITADGSGDNNSDATFSVIQGYIRDEDFRHFIESTPTSASFDIFYKTGPNGHWRSFQDRIYPILNSTNDFGFGGGLATYNEFTGGIWQQTETTANSFILAHVFAGNDPSMPLIVIQGENAYNTVALARAGATQEIFDITTGDVPLAEFIPLGTIIYEIKTGYSNVPKARIRLTDEGGTYVDFRTIAGTSTPGTNVNDHGQLAGLSHDDHLQYAILDGSRNFESTMGGVDPVAATDFVTLQTLNTRSTSISAASLEGDRTLNTRSTSISAASLEAERSLQTQITDHVDTVSGNPHNVLTTEITDFTNAVGAETELTGVVGIEDLVSLNTDITKIDIIAFDYWIQGNKFNYPGGTAITPTIAASDTSTWVAVTSGGLVYNDDKFTHEEKQTTLPIARLQAVQNQSGPGSDLQTPLQSAVTIGQFGYTEGEWVEAVIGSLYETGGTVSENGVNPLQVDQSNGSFHNAQKRHITISSSTNIQASSIYHVSGVYTAQTRTTLIIPKYYDDGTDIVALSNNKYASHTLLRSPKEEDLFFFVYSNEEYASQATAEAAAVDYGFLISQRISGMMPVARFVVKGDGTHIHSIVDERPLIGVHRGNVIGIATLQQVYDNSADPEIVTDSIREALTIKRGSAADTDNVLEIQNGAGSDVAAFTGEGDLVLSGTVDGIDVATDVPANTANIISVSGASSESDNRFYRTTQLDNIAISGASIEHDRRIEENHQLDIDDVRGRISSHGTSAHDRIYDPTDPANDYVMVTPDQITNRLDGIDILTVEHAKDGHVKVNGDFKIGNPAEFGYFQAGIGPSGVDGLRLPSGSEPLTYHGELYATKVFNAVWNDVADFQPVEGPTVFGKCYFMTNNAVRLCHERCQIGIAGVASDTFGQGVGMGPGRIPIAIAGWVLAYVDKEYPQGTPLTNDKDGNLTKMTFIQKIVNSERMVGLYHRKELKEFIEDVAVKGRHWVKVK